MGQLIAVFGIDWRLLIAEGLNFVILLVILTYFLYRPVMKLLAERQEKIRKGLEDAAAAETAREAAAAERVTVLSEANHQAKKIVARAEEEGKAERAATIKAAEARAAAVVADAQKEAEEAKRRALKEADAEIAKNAILAAEKILKQS